MSGIEFTRSRFPGEREIREALEDDAVEVFVVADDPGWRHAVSGVGIGVDAATHQSIGKAGSIELVLPKKVVDVLKNHLAGIRLRLILVAHSVSAAVSAVLVDTPLSSTGQLIVDGKELFKFKQRTKPTIDPLRASSTGYELSITGTDGLPIWKKSWTVKIQENKGGWLMYRLDEKQAEIFGVPKETYVYSDLEDLRDQDIDLNRAKFYVNADVYDRIHELPRADQCLLVRACLSDIVDHLAGQDAPDEGAHSLLQSIWNAYTKDTSMDKYTDDGSRLGPEGRRVLLGNIDRDMKIAKLSVEKLSSVDEEVDDEY